MWEAMEQTKQHGFGPEVKRRIMLGTYALSAGYYDAYYLKAQKVRTLISREFQEAFQKYDILVTPVSPTVAFKLGEKVEDPVQMYLSDICTIPVNIAGIPAMSVPGRVCGRSAGGDADYGQAPGRGDDTPRRLRLRAGNGVAHDETGAVISRTPKDTQEVQPILEKAVDSPFVD